MRRNTRLLSALARSMNAGGSAVVSVLDSCLEGFNRTVSMFLPDERTKLDGSIKELEKNSQALFVEIAKETSKYPDHAVALESDAVAAYLATIKELELEITRMKQRVADIDSIRLINK